MVTNQLQLQCMYVLTINQDPKTYEFYYIVICSFHVLKEQIDIRLGKFIHSCINYINYICGLLLNCKHMCAKSHYLYLLQLCFCKA